MKDLLYDLKNNLTENNIFLCFRGPLTQELMVEIGALLKSKLKYAQAGPTTILKVFSVFIEQSQNIIHHAAETDTTDQTDGSDWSAGVIAVGCYKNTYFVTAGNRIKNENVVQLRERLTQLQQMDRDTLNRLYREQRKNEHTDSLQPAGLGLIELARKSSKPVEFQFEEIDKALSFFSIKATIEAEPAKSHV